MVDYKIGNVTRRNISNDSYLSRQILNDDNQLKKNFLKCAKWVKENYPNLNVSISMQHRVYYSIGCFVNNGTLVLYYGSHGSGDWGTRVSADWTDTISQRSMQTTPYRYDGVFACRTDYLQEFLEQWQEIKQKIIANGDMQNIIFSDDFEP